MRDPGRFQVAEAETPVKPLKSVTGVPETGASSDGGAGGCAGALLSLVAGADGLDADSVGGVVTGGLVRLGSGAGLDVRGAVVAVVVARGRGDGEVGSGTTSPCGVAPITASSPTVAPSAAPAPPTSLLGPELGSPTIAGGRDGPTSMLPN
jgi:hypothetical protein